MIEQVYGERPEIKNPKYAAKLVQSRWIGVASHYLNQYDQCKTFHVLPKTGALEDQDYLVLRFFAVISACIADYRHQEYEKLNHK